MAAVLVATQYLFPPPKQAPGIVLADSIRIADSARAAVAAASASTSASTSAARAAAASPTIGATPDATGAVNAPVAGQAPTPIDTSAITTPRAVYRTTSLGAAMIGAEMTQYPTLKDHGRTKGAPVELANPGDPLLAFRLVLPGDTVRLDRQAFHATKTQDNGRTIVRYDATVASRAVSITYTFQPDSYRVYVAATVASAPTNAFLLVDLPPAFR